MIRAVPWLGNVAGLHYYLVPIDLPLLLLPLLAMMTHSACLTTRLEQMLVVVAVEVPVVVAAEVPQLVNLPTNSTIAD